MATSKVAIAPMKAAQISKAGGGNAQFRVVLTM
jgi:hypothetical protein